MKTDMPWHSVELEQGGSSLRGLASRAYAGEPILLTLNGNPYALIIAPHVFMTAPAPARFFAAARHRQGALGGGVAQGSCCERA